jgi:hypothetical protein
MGIKTIIVLLIGLALASVHLAFAQPAAEAQKKLQGTWTATKANATAKQPMTLSDIGSPSPATASRSSPRTASPSDSNSTRAQLRGTP